MKRIYSVPDMSCMHCKHRIESVVGGNENVKQVNVDLETKEVAVDSDLESADIIELFDEAGYDAALIER